MLIVADRTLDALNREIDSNLNRILKALAECKSSAHCRCINIAGAVELNGEIFIIIGNELIRTAVVRSEP